MRLLSITVLFLSSQLWGQQSQIGVYPVSTSPAGASCVSRTAPIYYNYVNGQYYGCENNVYTMIALPWYKYTVTAIANTVNGCANATGCWQVNGTLGANKTAGLTQSVTLFQLPANGYVNSYRIKSATACTGTTTLLTGLGTASSSDLFLVSSTGYDLKAAVSATNLTTALPLVQGSDTTAAVNVVASLTSTVDNLNLIVAGCSFDVWVLWSKLP